MKRFLIFLILIVFYNTSVKAQCSLLIDQNGPVCYGSCTGWATVIANGTPPYTYQWSNLTNQPDLISVCPGNYSVTVTDSTGCVATGSVTIAEYPLLTYTLDSFVNVTCFGYSNGEAWTTATGGMPPYTYNWYNGQNSSHVTGLSAINYYPEVMDSAGCFASTMVYISSPTEIIITENVSQPVCFSSSGYIMALASGGTPAGGASPFYNYNWSNGSTVSSITGLASGIYTVTVTDSLGCFSIKPVVLNTSDGPVPTITWSDITCYGFNNGIVTNVTNTTPVASCLWSTGSTVFNPGPQNLAPGDYSLTVTTPAGCNGFGYFTVLEPTAISDNPTQNDLLCYGDTTGSIYTGISGGTPIPTGPSYIYTWSMGATTDYVNNLAAGNYYVTVNDLNNCVFIDTFIISQPAALNIDSFLITNVSCNGLNDGFVSIFVSGGVFPYYYSIDSLNWDNYDTIHWLQPGINYHVIVKDDHYCKTSTPYFSVTEPAAMNVYSSWFDPTCVGNDGYASIDSVTGGTYPYSVSWDAPPYTGNVISNLVQGTYWATVSDANACENILWFDLFQNGILPELTGINNYSGGTLPPDEAKIYLFTPSNTGAAQIDTIAETANTATGWMFSGLLPGTYYLKADLINPASYPSLLNTYYDSTFLWQNAAPVVLSCNDSINILFKMYEMTPVTSGNGCITGTVIMLSGGKSTESVGEPVPGAEILIEQEPNDIPVQCAITDTSGSYTFTGLVAGTGYHLLVDIPGFPLITTYDSITITANDTVPNLNFLVDSTAEGGIYADTTSSFVSYIHSEGIQVEVFPNPFSSVLNVTLILNHINKVTLELSDDIGRKIQTFDAGELLPGKHDIIFNTNNLIKGPCFLVIRIGNTILMKKLMTVPR